MKKIPSLFIRDWEGNRSLVLNRLNPECAWVANGEGVATRKYDGTACMVRNGRLYKRFDAKPGRRIPDGFEPCQEPDTETGHQPGWVPVGDGPDDKWFRSAFVIALPNGTYELCGPHFQSNPEGFEVDVLVRHGEHTLDAPRTYSELATYLAYADIEGIVWHHPDGRMAKIKASDFGIKRGTPLTAS